VEDKYFYKLEFNKIVERLAAKTSFAISRELAKELVPFASIEEASRAITETNEAVDILRLYPTFSVGGVRDVREALKRAELGGVLDISELVNIADTCRASRQCKAFFSQIKGHYPIMIGLSKSLGIFKTLETAMNKAITPENTLADESSERLYQIRKKMRHNQDKIKERLENFIHNVTTAKYLQDPIVTIRDGRYVVPVKQEYRAQVPGVVHDMSSSGATVFIEPMGVMEANNEILKLKVEEQDEINAILRALTMVVVSFLPDIQASLAGLAELDFIVAKGRLSGDMDATPAKLNNKGNILLKRARHPLINADVVVPVNVVLGSNLSTMVITGPNTGGKTVTLKTIGLLTMMALSGLYIPADDGSEVAFYTDIFADIGDEQSIEQSLSTFSSHMTNIVHILTLAGLKSLVLMDELGAGTDPQEGAALAMAILEYLAKMKAKVVATTHYSELKSFAYNQPGFINASVEFDVETLQPTYRLLMGIPGKSNAFEIARKLGLREAIVQKAAGMLSADDTQVADLIAGLEKDRQMIKEELQDAQELRAKLQEDKKKLEIKEVNLKNQEAEIITKAHEESLNIIEKTKKASEELYQQLKEEVGQISINSRLVQGVRESLKNIEADLQEKIPERQYVGEAPKTVELGQHMEVPKLNLRGYVLSLPNASDDLLIQAGIMKITVKLGDLRIIEAEEEKKSKVETSRLKTEKASSVVTELDLRGYMVDEAIPVLDKYLDDVFMTNLKQVRIIHGKGTGALRTGLQQYLKQHRLVKSIRMGDFHEGSLGVTVVELDK